jgi:electron transfer flavoprotein beta subunit
MLAELLGLPHVTLVVQVDRAAEGLRVKRELEAGWYQFADTPLPALLTIQSGIGKLRYATLMGIKKAKTKELRRLTAAELGLDVSPGLVIDRLFRPERSKQTVILPGDARQAAAALVEKLKFEARVL